MGVKGFMLKATVLFKTLPCSFWQGNWRPFDNHSLVRALLAKKTQRVIIIWLSLIPFDVFPLLRAAVLISLDLSK